jgi:signal transduction histidine kinase
VDELQANLHSPDMAQKLAAIAIRESDQLNQIVSGFLDFARSPNVKREVFDLRDVVTEVGNLLRHEHAHAERLAIHTVLPDRPCTVSGTPTQMKQVFMNLGKNAIEAMEESGTLTITVAPCPGSFEIRFNDEGPGIPPDKITRIFEPFYTEKEKGVGMGLAICSRIITAHDGTIRAGSREGGGAALTVRLPAAPRP